MCTNPLDARNLLLSSQLLDSREKTVSALDAIAGVTPVSLIPLRPGAQDVVAGSEGSC